MFYASTDNTVVLPGLHPRRRRASSTTLTRALRAQVNVENLFDASYYPYANSNNNITPGSPFAARFALTTRF